MKVPPETVTYPFELILYGCFSVTSAAERVIAMPLYPSEHTSAPHENLPLVDIFRSPVDGSDRCEAKVQS